ncbi:MAG TPA: hypothetical protein VNA25_08000 [Phycisphaerae bacterium]|nr:hypothetical protein [Phycisphaerae bacterium]HUT57781.1 hypothetical protein [Phycisphaerae bacterium]
MRAVRLEANPIICPEMLQGDDGANINGPSLISAPDWLPGRLGRYYLYFAHHAGKYIRLAIADDLAGPWRVHGPGTLRLEDTPCWGHVASPDVHVLNDAREVRMYFHGPVRNDAGEITGQFTFAARSQDGLSFKVCTEALGPSYFRVLEWGGRHHALCRGGQFLCSRDGLTAFEQGPNPFRFEEGIVLRHAAVQVRDDALRVFYSRIGDAPERILLSEIGLAADWHRWTASPPVTVLEPAEPYEGADRPIESSVGGLAGGPVRQLRDPAIHEEDGRTYLLYSVAGESGVAVAALVESPALR